MPPGLHLPPPRAIYEDGVVYSAAGSFIFALDAKTGQPLEGFGENGQASVILDVLRLRYPEVEAAIDMGYWFTTAPQIYDGVLYIGSTRSESHIPGGHVLAVDARKGKVIWYFNTIPQDEKDQGWEIAGPTWVGGIRNGGGIWETPSIDPELGLLYVAVGNPFGDSTKRAGINLFTDSILALSLETARSSGTTSRCITTSGTTTPAISPSSSTWRSRESRSRLLPRRTRTGISTS